LLQLDSTKLFERIALMVEASRQRVAATVNAELSMLYWNIGKQLQEDVLQNDQADYGEQIIATVSQQLTARFGKGFTYSALTRMLRFYKTFPDAHIIATLSQQLSWSHFVELIGLKDDLQRQYYMELCRLERWSVRQLRERIDSMLFERTALSKKPDELMRTDLQQLQQEQTLTPDLVFRDPYILNFLGLSDTFSEKDLEAAIIAELQQFITELGNDFAFLARQKRIIIDNEDYYIDLLFYHRRLRRLVAIDLKLGKFRPGDKAQMELYLNWLDRYEKVPGEETPIGLILCADKSDEHIELLMLNEGNIRVAQYLTELPDKDILQEKLHRAREAAQARLRTRGHNSKEQLPETPATPNTKPQTHTK
jgi:predicted nuclease of restriction endonuclease-like (RecB) superfamily